MFKKSILLAGGALLGRILEDSIFARGGFSLLTAAVGDEAFQQVEVHGPALVVFDWQAQGMSECYRRLKADPLLRGTPAILLAASGRVDEAEDKDAVLAYPPESSRLVAAACRLLQICERAGPRLPIRLPTRIGIAGDKLRPGRIRDLGAGGVYVETGRLLPVDSRLELRFSLPGKGTHIACRCRVAWVNHPEWVKKASFPAGMGVQFLDPGAAVERELAEFIERHREEER